MTTAAAQLLAITTVQARRPAIPVRVTLPIGVIVCPCGLHHMVKGQRVHRAYCLRLRLRTEVQL